ncbi:MaoC family dehydratase [Microbacterium sp. CPCC 204701]|uniref:MaoC family dehydratase n=1 Tax=Microbacterium sp. CPCC 204701 TaxID=2493084 RepID=UPI000FDACCBB|nr:MaoC family dehydratase [Microbacterium sp. CPCC 204701]
MTLRHDLVGVPTDPLLREWTDRETLLYALAVGAGAADPAAELDYTTENSAGFVQRVVPTFACGLASARSPRSLGDFDTSKLVHAEQTVVFHGPVPTAGSAKAVSTLTHVYDKAKSALLVQESVATDAVTGAPLATTTGTFMVSGEGGFGGDRGPKAPEWTPPDRSADHQVEYATRADQPLLYRLTGDRNPLHSDPAVARRAGFPRPIMHGMCTYGFTCRALVATAAGGDPDRLRTMSARFSKPALPGTVLTVEVWTHGHDVWFRTLDGDGEVVLDRGVATIAV